MKNLFNLILSSSLALAMAWPAWAENTPGPSIDEPTRQETMVKQTCPVPGQAMHLSQISQTDCCKGHKGVCGCRAGKIVCCDGTVSPDCTCHADSGFEN